MDASNLISLFAQETGVDLSLSEAGTASLIFESGPALNLEHDPQLDVLHCYVVLGQAPADPMRRHEVFRQMLAANAFGRDTDGATLGLDEVTGELLLSRRLELSRADTAWLRTTVESMAAVAADWQTRLNGSTPEAASDASSPLVSSVMPPDFGLRA